LILITKNPRYHCGILGKVRVHECEKIKGILALVHLIGLVVPQTHLVFVSTIPKYIIVIDIPHSLQNPHIGSMAGSKGYYGGKGQVEVIRTISVSEYRNPKQYCIPKSIAEVSATIKDLKCQKGGFHHNPM
jgi:hypothetical protein